MNIIFSELIRQICFDETICVVNFFDGFQLRNIRKEISLIAFLLKVVSSCRFYFFETMGGTVQKALANTNFERIINFCLLGMLYDSRLPV